MLIVLVFNLDFVLFLFDKNWNFMTSSAQKLWFLKDKQSKIYMIPNLFFYLDLSGKRKTRFGFRLYGWIWRSRETAGQIEYVKRYRYVFSKSSKTRHVWDVSTSQHENLWREAFTRYVSRFTTINRNNFTVPKLSMNHCFVFNTIKVLKIHAFF